MTARKKNLTLGPAHVCHQGCPKLGEASNDDQAEDAYRHHRAELEATLGRMLLGRKPYAAAFRPRWWWLLDEQAAAYRLDPNRFEDQGDVEASSVQLEPWVRASINRRWVEEIGRLRYLVRQDLLEPWELQVVLARGGVRTKAVKEELARRGSR